MVNKKNEAILVTGGAGYIGSHVVLELLEANKRVVVVDDLSVGDKSLVPIGTSFIQANVGQKSQIKDIIINYGCNTVMHFAGSIIVEESSSNPSKYYNNNVIESYRFIEACCEVGVEHIIFSSSAAVYGQPEVLPIPESSLLQPVNPYGTTKLITEWALRDLLKVTSSRYAVLRYFNVAGADANMRSGERALTSSHLIKIAAETVVGKRPFMYIFGEDYPTPDGTCIRDYIHVSDLAALHVAALEYLESGRESIIVNCGYGHGYSVRQILEAVNRVCDKPIKIKSGKRRVGDPPELVADTSLMNRTFGWKSKYDDIDQIVSSAIEWEYRLFNDKI